jgi:subtilisin family serine protease
MLLRLTVGGLCLVAILAGSAGGASKAGATSGQYIVVLKPGVSRAADVQQARALGGEVFMQYSHALNGYAARLPEAAVAQIERNPHVAFVTPDGEVSAAVACNPAAAQCLPAGIDRVDADRSSSRSGDGRGSVNVNVAVLDTGIDVSNPDLNVVGGKDCSAGKGLGDQDGHGTHVAGTIAALDNGIGVVGVAPGARLWAVRVLNQNGFGANSRIICGIDFVTSTRTNADPSDDILVANMSLKGPGSDDGNCGNTVKDAVHLAICASVAAGVTYVVAAGNSGVDFKDGIPAAYDEVLTVTAMTDFDGRPGGLSSQNCLPDFDFRDDTIAFFSDFATLTTDQAHTIAAPGLCVLSTVPGGYDLISGTSQAAPHVTGVVAICIASGSCAGLSPAQIMRKIIGDAATYNTANPNFGFVGDPLHPIDAKYYGYLIRAGLY